MADHYAIATEFYEMVLERRRGKGEIPPPRFDRGYELPKTLGLAEREREWPIADREETPIPSMTGRGSK